MAHVPEQTAIKKAGSGRIVGNSELTRHHHPVASTLLRITILPGTLRLWAISNNAPSPRGIIYCTDFDADQTWKL
jgi:hypothetical protein